MGIPLEPVIYSDDDCACYPADLTPQTLVMFVTGVTQCPGLPVVGKMNGAFICFSINPCEWRGFDGVTQADVIKNFGGTQTIIGLADTGASLFNTNIANPCANAGPNLNACLLFINHAENGNAFVDPVGFPGTARKFTEDFNLLPSEETFTDPYIIETEPPTTVVYTLANIQYSTKLRIKFDYTV